MPSSFETFAGSWLLTYALHSTLLLGLTWLLTRRPGVSASRRDVLWKAGMVGGLLTATLQTALPFEPLSGVLALSTAVRNPVTASQAAEVSWQGLLAAPVPAAVSPEVTTSFPAAPPAAPVVAGDGSPVVGATAGGAGRGLTLALWGWAGVGAALLGLYLVQRRRALQGMGPRVPVTDPGLLAMVAELRRAGAVRRPVRLTQAAGLASPVALGRDEIVLPGVALTELDAAQQRSLLAHELAHLVRRDPMWLALGCALERVFFFQPLNRLARVRLQEAAEYLCDDWAVRRTGSGVSLASCLVKVAEWVTATPQPVPLAGMAERRSQLVTRIHRLIEGRPMPNAPRTLWFAAGAVALLGVTAITVPTVTAHAQQPVARDSVATDSAGSDSSGTLRRLWTRMRSAEWRAARADMARLRSEAWAPARAPVAPEPPRAPRAPMPALAPMVVAGADAWRELAAARAYSGFERERPRDTTSIAVPALIGALTDRDVDVRRAAAQALANLEDPRAVPGLIAALEDGDAQVRAYAALALGSLEDRRAVPGLLGLLKDGSVEVRRHALSALSSFPDGVPVDVVLSTMNDADPEMRQVAISYALSHLHESEEDGPADPRFVAAFTRLLKDPAADIRQMAVNAVAEAGLTQVPAELLAMSTDRSADVRQQVAYALGRIGDAKSVPALKTLLADANADVREAAITGLSEIRDRSALEALVGALRSDDPVIRRQAAMALGQRESE